MPAPVVAKELAKKLVEQKAKGGGVDQELKRALGQGENSKEENETRRRRMIITLVAPLAALAILLMVFSTILVAIFGLSSETTGPPGIAYPTGSGIPAVYWPMYVTAATYYHVSPYLLASIHEQETGFSTADSTMGGYNSNGCCAGPMQFNVKAGTWAEYEKAFIPIQSERPQPPHFYPSDRYRLSSCRGRLGDQGCVYDDFDAIAGAAEMLKHEGADTSLTSPGTHDAVCHYIGSCSEVDQCTHDENTYCQVLPRAIKWEALGRKAEEKAAAELGNIAGGPVRQEIVRIAYQQLQNFQQHKKGYYEGSGNCNPYGPCGPWCAMFSTWVWEHAGIKIREAVSRAGLYPYNVGKLKTYAQGHGLWRSTPQPGDMIIFSEHVGLVTGVKAGGRITEIGGNQSDSVTALGGTQGAAPDALGEPGFEGFMTVPEGVAK